MLAELGFSWNTECFSGDYLKEVTQAALVRVLHKGHGATVGWGVLGVLQGETANHTHPPSAAAAMQHLDSLRSPSVSSP